jgi:Tfp pilus assembly protein PilV
MTRTLATRGISIVEILVAVVFLAVGALAALGLQVSALRGSGTAESIQTLTRIAESELLYRRGVDKAGASLANAATCRVFVPDGFTCAVDVAPCTLASGAANCSGVAAADAVAHQVTVTTTSARGQDVVLTSLVAGIATGSAGSGGSDGGDTGDTGDNGDTGDTGEPGDAGDTGDTGGDGDTGDDGTVGGGDDDGSVGGGDDEEEDEPVACVPAGKSGKCKKNK